MVPAHLRIAVQIDQVDIEEAVVRVVGIKGEPEKAAFSGGGDFRAEIDKGGLQHLPGV